ncbi:hypothetical protein TSOC_000222, partial [Tetrabaena socialis]
SPEDAGADFSGEQPLDDNFSEDGEPENELEALQNLPAEERRKALRRLRNRESARRVRARRLAEMSNMEVTVHGMQDENTQLKAMTRKLQNHVYEITAKYESAVAENAQLRTELQVTRRMSMQCDSSFAAPTAPISTGQGPNSGPQYASPFVAPCGADGVDRSPSTAPCLSMGHATLRGAAVHESSAMDIQQQRVALEEVVFLLKEHKRRGHPAVANAVVVEHSTCSEIASTATGCLNNNNAAAAAKLPSPLPEGSMFGGAGEGFCTSAVLGQRLGSGGPSLPESGAAPSNMRAYQSEGVMMHAVDVRGGFGQSQLSLTSSLNAAQAPPLSQMQQIQQQHQMQQMQLQMQQQQQLAGSGPLSTFNLQPQQMHNQQQQQLAGMQGCSDPLLQLRQQQMLSQCGQQNHSAAMFSGLTAPFYSASSFLTAQGSGGQQAQANNSNNNNSGNNAMSVMQGGQLNRGGSYADAGRGFGGAPQGPAMHPQWLGHPGGPVVTMQCPDVPLDDCFMSLVDEFLPQDL